MIKKLNEKFEVKEDPINIFYKFNCQLNFLETFF